MIKLLPLLRTMLIGTTALAASASHATISEDTADPSHLIAAYHAAVVTHDGDRLRSLFVPQGSAWFSVLSEPAWMRLRESSPNVPKLRPGDLAGFIRMIATTKARLDPQHSNLKIVSDGEIASITFDYRFVIDGKVQNRGAESWQLIRGSEGWRIVSIIYSSTPAVAPKPG